MNVAGTSDGLVTHAEVYGLEESVAAAGFSYLKTYDPKAYDELVDDLKGAQETEAARKRMARMQELAAYKPGEGHHCSLAGVVVQFNLTCPRYFWQDIARYHFLEPVTSTSTNHSLLPVVRKSMEMEGTDQPLPIWDAFTKGTSMKCISAFYEEAKRILAAPDYEMSQQDKLKAIKKNLPEGFLVTIRLTTNYRQLKTIYMQRRYHVLDEFRAFCKWIESLPYADWITGER